MFRPTHFVVLSAVLLCAYAAPADPQPLPAKDGIPIQNKPLPALGSRPGGPNAERPLQAGPGPIDRPAGDLDTDATHWGYTTYYAPGYDYNNYVRSYYGGWGGRAYNNGWGLRYWGY